MGHNISGEMTANANFAPILDAIVQGKTIGNVHDLIFRDPNTFAQVNYILPLPYVGIHRTGSILSSTIRRYALDS